MKRMLGRLLPAAKTAIEARVNATRTSQRQSRGEDFIGATCTTSERRAGGEKPGRKDELRESPSIPDWSGIRAARPSEWRHAMMERLAPAYFLNTAWSRRPPASRNAMRSRISSLLSAFTRPSGIGESFEAARVARSDFFTITLTSDSSWFG